MAEAFDANALYGHLVQQARDKAVAGAAGTDPRQFDMSYVQQFMPSKATQSLPNAMAAAPAASTYTPIPVMQKSHPVLAALTQPKQAPVQPQVQAPPPTVTYGLPGGPQTVVGGPAPQGLSLHQAARMVAMLPKPHTYEDIIKANTYGQIQNYAAAAQKAGQDPVQTMLRSIQMSTALMKGNPFMAALAGMVPQMADAEQ